MFIGEYTHVLDNKKRISLPSTFKKELGKKIVLTRGLDNCVFIYSLSSWKIISEKLSTLSIGKADSRGFSRFTFAGAVEINVDASGRILVPDFLKEFAGLKSKVVLAGVHNRVEVWNEKVWNEYKGRIEKQADTLAEKLGEIGMI